LAAVNSQVNLFIALKAKYATENGGWCFKGGEGLFPNSRHHPSHSPRLPGRYDEFTRAAGAKSSEQELAHD
jgi:hypothetical protein